MRRQEWFRKISKIASRTLKKSKYEVRAFPVKDKRIPNIGKLCIRLRS
jgi:hypothetical protein